MNIPKFALNRHDISSVSAFAQCVLKSEQCGWDAAFLPDSQLRRRDSYVLLAAAAQVTDTIHLGTLLTNPVTRHPTVTASSIATVAELAPGRTLLGTGIGDTAVRLAGLKPARMKELEESVVMMQSLLAGEDVEVGAPRPANLPFSQDVPVWVAAGGPKTLQMAGGCADGVFIRVGTHPENIRISVDRIRQGARESGRDPEKVKIGAVFHTVFVEEPEEALLMGKSMAAGYYEYSPMLMNNIGMDWTGPHPDEFKSQEKVWPDFHHAPDLVVSGRYVDFLSEEQANSFCLKGTAYEISKQLATVIIGALNVGVEFEYVVLHPIPDPLWFDPEGKSYMERVPREVFPKVKDLLLDTF